MMMGCGSSMDTNSVLDEPHTGMGAMPPYQTQWPLSEENPKDVVSEFVRLDIKISKLEGTCPGPRLATCEAWIEHLQIKRNELMGLEAQLLPNMSAMTSGYSSQSTSTQVSAVAQQKQQSAMLPSHIMFDSRNDEDIDEMRIDGYTSKQSSGYANNAIGFGGGGGGVASGSNMLQKHPNQNGILPFNTKALGNGVAGSANRLLPANDDIVAKTPSQDLVNLALNLGVVGDVQKASTHEDFFAQLSESALHLISLRCYSEILEHTKVRLKTLMESYAELNELYVNHDGLIAFISGGTYMSRLEANLDSQLEAARDIRDKLGSTLEQWRICGLLLRACANSATQSLKQWRKIKTIVNPREKVETALACRKDLQASLVSLECAQLSLPHVEIKYTSNRQILAVKHCNTYLITDIANLARYEHTSKVFTAYEANMSKATSWLYETFNKSLRHDFDRAEDSVKGLAKTLRDHREEIFTAARK